MYPVNLTSTLSDGPLKTDPEPQLKFIFDTVVEEIGFELDLIPNTLDEANITRMGRTKLVRVRIRGGKVQRRKKVSAVKGYTLRGGKMVRMSAQERMHRKRAARKSKFKRRAKLRQALRKRKMSLRRRNSMGL